MGLFAGLAAGAPRRHGVDSCACFPGYAVAAAGPARWLRRPAERSAALAHRNRLTFALVALAGVMLLVLATFFALQWRAKQRLQAAYERYRGSERRYRMLADNSRDLVVRLR